MKEVDPSYPEADEIAAHLHFEATLELADPTDSPQAANEIVFEQILDWLRSNRKDLPVHVSGGRTFPMGEFAPVIPMPEAPKPFSAVRGISFVRESDEPVSGSLVYEVHVQVVGAFIPVSVSFRAKFGSGSDAIEKLLQSASEIAEFGVRKRTTGAE